MATSMSTFIGKIGQGVKPNQFSVEIPFAEVGVSPDTDLTNLLCKSAALPGSNLGVIEVPFRGRTIKIAGDRTFDTWSATFFNDKTMQTRSLFEAWLNTINSHNENAATNSQLGGTEGSRYDVDIKVVQEERNAPGAEPTKLRTYLLKYAFPTSVSQIDLAYDSNDQIEEFTVEFQYSYWQVQEPGVSDIAINT